MMDIRDYLTELFLDTEFTDADAKFVARGCVESGLDMEEIENILFNEVALVCLPHLASGVGPWAGWPDGWIQKQIADGECKKIWSGFDYKGQFEALIQQDWEKVKLYMKNDNT